jgi:hypothetical protein
MLGADEKVPSHGQAENFSPVLPSVQALRRIRLPPAGIEKLGDLSVPSQ